ncbi:hypothetical protein GWK47_004683 [Chionoecetes opilio]|uniref:Uncharacterized protein n=1 Tax=Chionoecetes opilio TaxID=41210 RepID=A0A8J4YCG4_CHIOP|nr:hypothetical protein GWK47_004683 [Chionoecetes opilio]
MRAIIVPLEQEDEMWLVCDVPALPKDRDHWELLDESGSLDRWTYRLVTYEGMVGQWLLGLNENRGEVVVQPVSPPDHYFIQESYLTSSLHGLLLIKNHGITNIRRGQREGRAGTLLVHDTSSDCPLLFHYLCVVETDLNRHVFLANLFKWFDEK